MKKHLPTLTAGELITLLKAYPSDMLIDFSQLDFKRIKQRSPNVLQIEFNETVYRDKTGHIVVENH